MITIQITEKEYVIMRRIGNKTFRKNNKDKDIIFELASRGLVKPKLKSYVLTELGKNVFLAIQEKVRIKGVEI